MGYRTAEGSGRVMQAKKSKAFNTFKALTDSQYHVLQVCEKLHSYGVLLYGQGDEADGYTELRGLGIELKDLAAKLKQVWRALDQSAINL